MLEIALKITGNKKVFETNLGLDDGKRFQTSLTVIVKTDVIFTVILT